MSPWSVGGVSSLTWSALSAINTGQYDKVKYGILGLHRASRKARDRRRVGPLEQ